jgi:alpha-L-fucosidase
MRTCLTTLLLISLFTNAQNYQPDWSSLDKRPLPQWYQDAKFGIFIHWGVYSVPAFCSKGNYAEWYQHALSSGDSATVAYHRNKYDDQSYYRFADQFRAELFDPGQWAKLIEASGAKYVVLTSKHHDGFANWPSREASRDWGFAWNSVDAGPHRDLLGDLFKAIRKTSVHAGMYYSLYEWYNPLWLKDRNKYVHDHMWPQMKELINLYKPDVFWTDGDWDASDTVWKSRDFLAWLYNESSVKDRVVTNDRWGSGIRFHHGGIYTPEYQPLLDFEDHYWEENRGMGFSYGFNRMEDAWDYNSAETLILSLIDKVSRGGNFLLDIGPDAHGKIPPIMEERLLQIGDWMRINQEAIYNTVRWRQPSQWSVGRTDYKARDGGGNIMLKLTLDPDPGYAVKECFFTYNPEKNDLCLILPQWPGKSFLFRDIRLPAATRIELLENHLELHWSQQGENISIDLPEYDPSKLKSKYCYVIRVRGAGAFAGRPQFKVEYSGAGFRPYLSVQPAAGTELRYTTDGQLPDEHSPQLDTKKPFTVEKTEQIRLRSFGAGLLPGGVIGIPLKVYDWQSAIKNLPVQPGLKESLYALENPVTVGDLDHLQPELTKIVEAISLKDTLRRENTGMRFEGFIKVDHDGLFTFTLNSDDGSKLLVDGELLIDNDGLHGDQESSGKAALRKGLHRFRLDYFQATGSAALDLKIDSEKGEKKSVAFYH